MNKAMKDLLKIMSHQKAAKRHLELARDLATKRYQHGAADHVRAAEADLAESVKAIGSVFGSAAMAAVRRAR